MPRPMSMTIEEFSPELADMLVDQTQRTLAKGSSLNVEWRCQHYPEHTWFAKPYNRTNAKHPTGCPICTGKTVLPGFNDIATTHPEVAELIVDPHVRTTVTALSNKRTAFSCSNPLHDEWIAPIARVAGGARCPQCSGRTPVIGVDDLATTHPHLAAELLDPRDATRVKAGSGPVMWKCTADPTHTPWSATVASRVNSHHGCPHCSGRVVTPGINDLATTHPELAEELVDPAQATTCTARSDDRLEWRCTRHPEHTWMASPGNRTRLNSGCPICANKVALPGFNDINTTHPELTQHLYDPLDGTTVTYGSNTQLRWVCASDSSHTWLRTPQNMLLSTACPVCTPSGESMPEREIVEIIRTLRPDLTVLTHDRTTLSNGQELDVVIPELKLAFEFNGVWWHCEANIPNTYHEDKKFSAQSVSYRLVHLWEDDWREKKNIVIRAIAHRIGATHNLALLEFDPQTYERIAARKLTTDRVHYAEAREFLNENHLQGFVNSSHYFGLRDANNNLRALLSVGETNHGSTQTPKSGVWDIQRYATRGIIAGGFTKLLSFAEKSLAVTTWTSYSDDDISDGGMYRTAGFTLDTYQKASYSYVGALTGWTRVHRLNYTKERFKKRPELRFKEGLTEHELAHLNKLYRIFDAGKTRWIKHL